MSCKIFVCFHKPDTFVNVPNYFPIHVGKAKASIDLGFIGDNTGDNISEKNPWYCELTAQYWIWKNVFDADYVGLCHYRRFFNFHSSLSEKIRGYCHTDFKMVANKLFFSESDLRKYDVILAKKTTDPLPLYDSLCMCHVRDDADILRNIVEEKYPDYIPSYDSVIVNGNCFSSCNMMIAKKEIFDEYSRWLFDILFEFEKRLTIPADPYQPRLFGFYSERLLNVFFNYKQYRIGKLPLLIIKDQKNYPAMFIFTKNLLRNLNCLLYKKLR